MPVIPLDYVIALSAGARKLSDFISDWLFVHINPTRADRSQPALSGLNPARVPWSLDEQSGPEHGLPNIGIGLADIEVLYKYIDLSSQSLIACYPRGNFSP